MRSYNIKQKFLSFTKEKPFQAAFIGFIALLFGVAMTFGLALPHYVKGQEYSLNNPAPNSENNELSANNSINPRAAAASFADVVEKVSPAVVTIRADIKTKANAQDLSPFMNDPMFKEFFGGRMPQQQQQPRTEHALGSGVIVSADGTILTNNHVVDGAEKIRVELPDRRGFDAKVVGTDAPSDLAVLKIEAKDLPTLPLGNSDQVRIGDVVLALGNPLGLRQTVTSGIISAKGRQTGLSDGSFEDFLQTDAPINHGNSGGALVNLNGELIGINSQILSPSGGNIGIGFAIPSNMAKSVMDQLIKSGKVHRGMLGVGIQDITSDLAASFGLKDVNGILINSVKSGGAAEKAGIKQGDVITAINGQKVSDTNELRNKVANTSPGTEISLTILRDGNEQTVKTKLDEFAAEKTSVNDSDEGNSDNSANSETGGKLGVTVAPLTPEIASQLELKNVSSGVVITNVQSGSKAADAGLQRGDVILQINRQEVNNLDSVKSALAKSADKPALLLINRQNQTLYVTV